MISSVYSTLTVTVPSSLLIVIEFANSRETLGRGERSLASVISVLHLLLGEAGQMRSIAKMMRHVVIAALLAVLVNGAPRSSIIYADDIVVSDIIMLSIFIECRQSENYIYM